MYYLVIETTKNSMLLYNAENVMFFFLLPLIDNVLFDSIAGYKKTSMINENQMQVFSSS